MKLHRHHKLPKYKGGTDDESNIVLLSKENHSKLHLLRYYLFNDPRELGAYNLLTLGKPNLGGNTFYTFTKNDRSKGGKTVSKKQIESAKNRKIEPASKYWKVTSPAGCVMEIRDLKKFCKDYDFPYDAIKAQKYRKGFSINNKWRFENAV